MRSQRVKRADVLWATGDGAFRRARYQARVFAQRHSGIRVWWRDICFFPCRARLLGEGDVESPRVDVNGDLIAVSDEPDGSATSRLWGDVADHETARRAGEPPVGDQGDLLAQPLTHERRRDREHLPHPRTACGPLVANDHDVAGCDLAR